MIHRSQLFACLFAATLGLVMASRDAVAQDRVWARTNWGASNVSRPYGTPNNGYGGYYVPRNARGNNYDGQRVMNPNGFFIPAQQPVQYGYRYR